MHCLRRELQCPPEFIALMLRDIAADVFDEKQLEGASKCDCC